jgi:hypothetical protein
VVVVVVVVVWWGLWGGRLFQQWEPGTAGW